MHHLDDLMTKLRALPVPVTDDAVREAGKAFAAAQGMDPNRWIFWFERHGARLVGRLNREAKDA